MLDHEWRLPGLYLARQFHKGPCVSVVSVGPASESMALDSNLQRSWLKSPFKIEGPLWSNKTSQASCSKLFVYPTAPGIFFRYPNNTPLRIVVAPNWACTKCNLVSMTVTYMFHTAVLSDRQSGDEHCSWCKPTKRNFSVKSLLLRVHWWRPTTRVSIGPTCSCYFILHWCGRTCFGERCHIWF